MRRWSLTLFLLVCAGVAVALAPRLLAAAGVMSSSPVIPAVPELVSQPTLMDTGRVAAQVPSIPETVAVPPPHPVRPVPVVRPVAPVRPPPLAPKDRGLLIPELDEEPHVDWSEVPPPAPAPDASFWDDCPGCGMG